MYIPGNHEKNVYDRIANVNNTCLTYTDEHHPVTILNANTKWLKQILINSGFFEQYREQLKEFIKMSIISKFDGELHSISIPDFVVDDDLVNIIISNENLADTNISIVECLGEYLTPDQIKKLSESRLEISLYNENVSTKYAIGLKTWKELETSTSLSFKDDLREQDIANFVYINENAVISIGSFNRNDEPKYVDNLLRIFKALQSHNRKYNIKVEINNRELLMQSGILDFSNINLVVSNDLYEYGKEEFLKEDEKLEQLVKPIREADLSPYEKYLAVYNVVKQFKPYKENEEDKEKSRYLRYILADSNEYIVCVGYAKLLTTLLNKVGIPAYNIGVGVDISYDKGVTQEEIPTDIAGHERNIVKIDDDKYNIHGVFVADATWDNDMEHDLYNNSAMTFDRKKEAFRLETLSDEDLLLDFHNFDDFSRKVNFYLKRKIEESFYTKYNDKIVYEFRNMYDDILKILCNLDYSKYSELYDKYNELVDKVIKGYSTSKYSVGGDKVSLKEVETVFNDFLTEYANYIIPLSNQAISNDTLLEALTNVKRQLGSYSEDELKDMAKRIEELNAKVDNKAFPYRYAPNSLIPNYLEARSDEAASPNKSR